MSSEIPSLTTVAATPITLLVKGEPCRFQPLTIELLAGSVQRCVDNRLKSLLRPDEVLPALKGHDREIVLAALAQLRDERDAASNPSIDDVMQWIMVDPNRMCDMLMDCIVGDLRPGKIDLAQAIENDETDFLQRWMEASGLAVNPTRSESDKSNRKQAVSSARKSRSK